MPTIKGKLAPGPYTDADRARLLAPITIRSYGGKSWGGLNPSNYTNGIGHRKQYADGDRYSHTCDWPDLDTL